MNIKTTKWISLFFTWLFLHSCTGFKGKNRDHTATVNHILANASSLLRTNPSGVILYIGSAYRSIPNPGPGDLYLKYDLIRKYYFEYAGDPVKTLKYTDSMLNVLQPYATEPAYNLKYAEAYLDRGDLLFKQKKFNAAYVDYYTAKATMITSKNNPDSSVFLFDFYTRLSDVSYEQGHFLNAVNLNKQAVAAFLHCSPGAIPGYRVQGIYDNIAVGYDKSGIADSSIAYYQKALAFNASVQPKDIASQKDAEIAKGVILGNIGSVYFKKGKFKLAEQQFKESIAINGRNGYAEQDALITQVKLAELYVQVKQLDKASFIIQQITTAKDTLPGPLGKLKFIMLQAAYATAAGHTAEATKLLQQYIFRMDALKYANSTLMSSDFSKDFELLKRRYDMEYLQKKNQVKNFFLVGALLVFIMAIVIIYLILKSNRQAKASALEYTLHNRQLELALNALETSSQENIHLLSVVAHDLKNPISAIYGISAMMNEEDNRTAEDKEMLELIMVSSKNLDLIIYDLLAAKGNKSLIKAQKSVVDLRDVLKESVELLHYRANEKRQKIIFDETGTCLVQINKDRVWRVLNNLIVNAIKFSPMNTAIHVKWVCDKNEATVSVIDNGIGIPAELVDKIFQLSSDAKRQGTQGEETYGLGLYISKQIIEEQGGKIWLESIVGKGTSFHFTLPVAH